MKLIFAFVIFSALMNISYSQTLHAIIKDSLTKTAIPYATVFFKSNPKKGCYAGADGYFDLNVTNGDTLCIRSLGYKERVFPVTMKFDQTIFILRDTAILPDVSVKNKWIWDKHPLNLGFHQQHRELSSHGSLGAKVIVFIKSPDSLNDYKIQKLFFQINKATPFNIPNEVDRKHFSNGRVRILLYDADSLFKGVLASLLISDIVCESANRNFVLEVDVTDQSIYVPGSGVFLGLEWLGETENYGLSNITPWYYRSMQNEAITLFSFFGEPFNFSNKNSEQKDFIYAPNFGMQVIKCN